MKVRELLKLLEKDGWYVDRTRGSHRQLHHATKAGTVTIPEPTIEAGKVAVSTT